MNNINSLKKQIKKHQSEKKEIEYAIEVIQRSKPDEDLSPLVNLLKRKNDVIAYLSEEINKEVELLDAARYARNAVMEHMEGHNVDWKELYRILTTAITNMRG